MEPLDASATKPLDGGASFSLGNRIFRVFWGMAWLALARFTPPPLHGWRRLVLRAFGARIGAATRVHGSVRIWHPGNLELGANVLVGPGAILYNQGQICVGDYSVISQRAHLCASTHDIADDNFQLVCRPIDLGTRCWVAAEAFVGPGVTMAPRSILGARGALFADTIEGGVYGGNPARLLKERTRRA